MKSSRLPSSLFLFIRLYLILVLFFGIQVLISYWLVHRGFLKETQQDVDAIIERVKNDLRFTDGKWDTSLYNSDPFTAYPNSSSSYPLYIVTTEGFVIERSKPISEILDTSDFKHLIQFQTPQLLTTVTNEHWRVLSKEVIRNGKSYGVIMVALYNPPETQLENTDKQLKENLEKLDSVIRIENDKMNVDKVDVRSVQYLVSFEIVDTFNKVLANDGRVPTFIDPSYVSSEFEAKTPRIVLDKTSNQRFLVDSQPIFDHENNRVAVVVAARTIQPVLNTLDRYFYIAGVGSLLLPILLSLMLIYFFNKVLRNRLEAAQIAKSQPVMPKSLSFDKKQSVLYIDGQSIEIPYSTNQYYLCKAIFSSPKKRWEQDELVEQMGDEPSSEKFRKVYDAALAINKKTSLKLISYQDKTYFLNSEFLPLLNA